jgi:hypothetical protein
MCIISRDIVLENWALLQYTRLVTGMLPAAQPVVNGCETWDFHSDEDSSRGLLGFDAM